MYILSLSYCQGIKIATTKLLVSAGVFLTVDVGLLLVYLGVLKLDVLLKGALGPVAPATKLGSTVELPFDFLCSPTGSFAGLMLLLTFFRGLIFLLLPASFVEGCQLRLSQI